MSQDWLRAINKAASALRFTANSWDELTKPAKAELLSIATTLTEIESGSGVANLCNICGKPLEGEKIPNAIVTHRKCLDKVVREALELRKEREI